MCGLWLIRMKGYAHQPPPTLYECSAQPNLCFVLVRLDSRVCVLYVWLWLRLRQTGGRPTRGPSLRHPSPPVPAPVHCSYTYCTALYSGPTFRSHSRTAESMRMHLDVAVALQSNNAHQPQAIPRECTSQWRARRERERESTSTVNQR